MEALDHRLCLAMENRLTGMASHIDGLRRMLHAPGTMLGHLAQRTDDLAVRLEMALRHTVARYRGVFDRLQDGLEHRHPAREVSNLRQRISLLAGQSEHLISEQMEVAKHRFANSAARLEVLSPLKTLSRGYAIASTVSGTVVTETGQLSVGDRIGLHLHHGRALCRVEELEQP